MAGPRHREPWAKTRLKGEPSRVCRGRQKGHDLVEKLEARIAPLDHVSGIAPLAEIDSADGWFRRIGEISAELRLFESMDVGDAETLLQRHGVLHKEVALIVKLSDRIGLNPSSRSKFIVEAAGARLLEAQTEKISRGFSFDD